VIHVFQTALIVAKIQISVRTFGINNFIFKYDIGTPNGMASQQETSFVLRSWLYSNIRQVTVYGG
jgi:hypothetical protein